MNAERRAFFVLSLVLTGTAAAAPFVSATLETAAPPEDLITRMTWLNAPASWKKSGEQLFVRSKPIWRG
jgi:hypothetical protein